MSGLQPGQGRQVSIPHYSEGVHWTVTNREYFELLGGNLKSEDTRKKGKGAKPGAFHDWRSFYLSQYDWLKGSHMTKYFGFQMKPIIHTANLWRQILLWTAA